jgi:hypothetical protein
MKKTILIICIFFTSVILAQENKTTSFEVDLIGFRDIMDNGKNNYSPGFSLLIHKKINKIKLSWGINFATRNFCYDFSDPNWDVNKMEHKLSYLNFPIFIGYTFYKHNKLSLDVVNGMIFNKLMSYNETIYYNNQETESNSIKVSSYPLGLTYRFGVNVTRRINNHFNINLQPFGDFKFKSNSFDVHPKSGEIKTPDNTISLGLKLGLEYLF